MKKLSLRARLSLLVMLLLTAVIVILTLLAMYNANRVYAEPMLSSMSVQQTQPDMEDAAVVTDMAAATVVSTAARQFNFSSLLIMLAMIAGGGILTYILLGRALKPIRDLSGEIQNVTENALSRRVGDEKRSDELGQLARSFNTMLERLDKAFAEQKRFSSDAAHELKTPLAVIKTNIDVLELDDMPSREEYANTVAVVKKQSDRMIRLVDDLFAMTSNRNYEFCDLIDFDSMFFEIAENLAHPIAEKALTIHIDKTGLSTYGNSMMLTRVFSNLIENAVKYNVNGGSIHVSGLSENGTLRFAIADTGIGIPEEQREHIFDPFYRVDKSRSRKIGGAGLGLAIAKENTQRHGGTIRILCPEKGGTIFTVELPQRLQPN